MRNEPETPLLLSLIRYLFAPMVYIGLAAYPFLLVFGPTTQVYVCIGVAYGCLFIRVVVRWINLRDDPMSAGMPHDDR